MIRAGGWRRNPYMRVDLKKKKKRFNTAAILCIIIDTAIYYVIILVLKIKIDIPYYL